MDSDDEQGLAAKKDESEEKPKKKKKRIRDDSCLGKLKAFIQDDHVRRGLIDPDDLLDKPDKNVLLKKVLNVLFLLTGGLLFVAVVVVIIYTALGKVTAPHTRHIVT